MNAGKKEVKPKKESDEKKEEKILLPRKPVLPCRQDPSELEVYTPGRTYYYDALPRDTKFAYMTPGYYATGFSISDVYKEKVDFSEYRNLLFIVDADLAHKWGDLKGRIPYPAGRITDLPGTRESNYKNYYLRSLTPESASSWRKSIQRIPSPEKDYAIEDVPDVNRETDMEIFNSEERQPPA